MSEEIHAPHPPEEHPAPLAPALADEIAKRRPRKVYMGMWGPLEIGVFGASMLLLLGAVLFYLLVVGPSSRELERSRLERDRLETELMAARERYGDITNTETQVAKLVSSVEDFEARFLPVETIGKTALYQRINGLIAAYGLVNTNGPAYAPLEPQDVEQANQSEEERGRARFRSLFPGLYVTMTVEGPYQNLRRFIREMETGEGFVVISSVELSPSETGNQPQRSQAVTDPNDPNFGLQAAQPTPARGRTYGERVALRLEMAAYFRRPGSGALAAAEPAPGE